MSFWCLQFPPKNEQKQVDLRFHSSKVEFVRSFFGGNVGLKKSFRLCLTFSSWQKKSVQHSKVKNEAKTRPSIALNAERFGPLRFAMKA